MKLICFFALFVVIKAEFWTYYERNNETLLAPNVALLERDDDDDPQKYFDEFVKVYNDPAGTALGRSPNKLVDFCTRK